MRKILQVITQESDELAEAIAAVNRETDAGVTVMRLSPDEPDYQELLEAVFAADSVQSW